MSRLLVASDGGDEFDSLDSTAPAAAPLLPPPALTVTDAAAPHAITHARSNSQQSPLFTRVTAGGSMPSVTGGRRTSVAELMIRHAHQHDRPPHISPHAQADKQNTSKIEPRPTTSPRSNSKATHTGVGAGAGVDDPATNLVTPIGRSTNRVSAFTQSHSRGNSTTLAPSPRTRATSPTPRPAAVNPTPRSVGSRLGIGVTPREDGPKPIAFTPTTIQHTKQNTKWAMRQKVHITQITIPAMPTIPKVFPRDPDGKKKVAGVTENRVAFTVNALAEPDPYRPALPTKAFWDIWLGAWSLVFVVWCCLHLVLFTLGPNEIRNSDVSDAWNYLAHSLEIITITMVIPWNFIDRRRKEMVFNIYQPAQVLLLCILVALSGALLFYGVSRDYMVDHWWRIGLLSILWCCCMVAFLCTLLLQLSCIILEGRSLFDQLRQQAGGIEKMLFTYRHTLAMFHDVYRASLNDSEKEAARYCKKVDRARDELERELRNPRHDVVVGDTLLFEDHQELIARHAELQAQYATLQEQMRDAEESHRVYVDAQAQLAEVHRLKQQEQALAIQQLKNDKSISHALSHMTPESFAAERKKQETYFVTLRRHQDALLGLRGQFSVTGGDNSLLQSELAKIHAAHESSCDLIREQAQQEQIAIVADHIFRYRALEDKHRALQVIYQDLRDREIRESKDPESAAAARVLAEFAKSETRAQVEETARVQCDLDATREELHQMEEVVVLLETMLDAFESSATNGSAGDRSGPTSLLSLEATDKLHRQMHEAMARITALGGGQAAIEAKEILEQHQQQKQQQQPYPFVSSDSSRRTSGVIAPSTETSSVDSASASPRQLHSASVGVRPSPLDAPSLAHLNAGKSTTTAAATPSSSLVSARGISARSRLGLLHARTGRMMAGSGSGSRPLATAGANIITRQKE